MVVSEFHSLNLPELPLRVVVQLLLQLPGSTRVAPAPAPARQKHQFGRHLLSHYRLFLIRVQQTSSFISSSSSSLSVCLCPEPITKVFLHFLLLHYVQFICSFHFILAICFHCHLIYIYLLVFLQWRFLPCNIFNWPARKPRRCHTIDSCGRIFAPVLHFSCNNFV